MGSTKAKLPHLRSGKQDLPIQTIPTFPYLFPCIQEVISGKEVAAPTLHMDGSQWITPLWTTLRFWEVSMDSMAFPFQSKGNTTSNREKQQFLLIPKDSHSQNSSILTKGVVWGLIVLHLIVVFLMDNTGMMLLCFRAPTPHLEGCSRGLERR